MLFKYLFYFESFISTCLCSTATASDHSRAGQIRVKKRAKICGKNGKICGLNTCFYFVLNFLFLYVFDALQ